MAFNNTKTPTLAEIKGKAKYQIPKLPGKGKVPVYTLEGELKDKFIQLFPKTPNRDMMRLFGIGFATMQSFKRELGLQKDMDVIRHKLAMQVKRICEKNGWYDHMREVGPSEACRKAAAEYRKSDAYVNPHILHRLWLTPRQLKAEQRKKSERRKEALAKDRKRVALGLKPRCNFTNAHVGAVRKYTRYETHIRYYAYKHGYAVGSAYGEERYCIFYDANTVRLEKFEKNAINNGFKVLDNARQ